MKNNTVRGFCYRNFIIIGSIKEYFIKLNIGIWYRTIKLLAMEIN